MVHRPGHPVSYAFPVEVVGDLPHEPVPEAPGYVQCRGTPSTPGSRRAVGWCTTHPTRTTESTAAPPGAGSASRSPAPRSSTPTTRSSSSRPRSTQAVRRPGRRPHGAAAPSDTSTYCNYKGDAPTGRRRSVTWSSTTWRGATRSRTPRACRSGAGSASTRRAPTSSRSSPAASDWLRCRCRRLRCASAIPRVTCGSCRRRWRGRRRSAPTLASSRACA